MLYLGVQSDQGSAMSWVTPKEFAEQVIQNVCDLPDYISPDDQPELLQCTSIGLEACVLMAFEYFDQSTHRSEVMNPPASAAQGAEARNLNMEQRHRTGAVLRGAEARPANVASVPPPYWVRTFWSPDRKYLINVHVTGAETNILTVQDDNGNEWEPTGEQQNMAL
jgi:hypothetical protein